MGLRPFEELRGSGGGGGGGEDPPTSTSSVAPSSPPPSPAPSSPTGNSASFATSTNSSSIMMSSSSSSMMSSTASTMNPSSSSTMTSSFSGSSLISSNATFSTSSSTSTSPSPTDTPIVLTAGSSANVPAIVGGLLAGLSILVILFFLRRSVLRNQGESTIIDTIRQARGRGHRRVDLAVELGEGSNLDAEPASFRTSMRSGTGLLDEAAPPSSRPQITILPRLTTAGKVTDLSPITPHFSYSRPIEEEAAISPFSTTMSPTTDSSHDPSKGTETQVSSTLSHGSPKRRSVGESKTTRRSTMTETPSGTMLSTLASPVDFMSLTRTSSLARPPSTVNVSTVDDTGDSVAAERVHAWRGEIEAIRRQVTSLQERLDTGVTPAIADDALVEPPPSYVSDFGS